MHQNTAVCCTSPRPIKVRWSDEIRLSRTAMLDESNSGSRMHDSMLASRSRRFRIALSGRKSPKSSIDDHDIN